MSKPKKRIRREFRLAVLKRDKHTCRKCGSIRNLDPHHITDRSEIYGGGYVLENGITLCEDCHVKAEVWHASGKTRHEEGFRPEDLYEIIGLNLVLATQAAEASCPSS